MKKQTAVLAVLLLAVCAGMLLLYRFFGPQTVQGDKHITVTVVTQEGETSFSYDTREEYLGPVLLEAGLIAGEESQYGLFITSVNGLTADESRQQWWCITKGGEQVNTGADQTPIQDGDQFELTLTEGY